MVETNSSQPINTEDITALREKVEEINRQETERKSWEQLTDSEKIERMRRIVKSSMEQIYTLRSENQRLRSELFQHSHCDGKIVVPISQYNSSGFESLSKIPSSGHVYI